jgi:outer membrane protein TolC
MRRLPLLALVLVCRSAAAEPTKLALDQVIARALANPKARIADGDRAAAAARVDEANAARLPRIKATAFATISPQIHCTATTTAAGVALDKSLCLTTEPRNFSFDFSGVFASARVDVTQPLYTFGKIAHARDAARAGLDAQNALADEAAGDLAVDAARAYWGVKLARELLGMLDDGIEEIEKAKKDFETRKDASIADKQRVAVLLAEAKVQRADAAQGEADALAGLRAITATGDADVDDAQLVALQHALPAPDAVSSGAARRPQSVAAHAGARAADALAGYEYAQYLPDFAVIGSAFVSKATGVDDPPSAFAWDPYRFTGAGVVLGLQWTIEPWNVAARVARARAEARKAHALQELADIGARYEASQALAEATAAHQKLALAGDGETAARAWLASVLQNQAIGTAEARDLADSYIAWFQMRARWAQAVFQWNVAVVRLGRATGEFRASGARPR